MADSGAMSLCEVSCAGETLLLHPDRALLWPARKMVLVADTHFGKADRFGRAGIAIPGGVNETGLTRLAGLSAQHDIREIVVLGDFTHSAPGANDSWLRELNTFMDHLDSEQIQLSVIPGNHDQAEACHLLDQRIRWCEETRMETPFVLRHEPGSDPRGYVLCGHVHPAYRLNSSRRQSIRAPVFWFREHCAVLPAFGEFTGGHAVSPERPDRLYLTGPDRVIPVPNPFKHTRHRGETSRG